MCYSYMKQEGVEVRVARTFNTFGPRMHMNDGRVISNFVLQALQGEPLTVYGSGSQTRAFQYVSDLVNGLVGLMNSNVSSPVNLGNPEEHTILEFARLIKQLVVVEKYSFFQKLKMIHKGENQISGKPSFYLDGNLWFH
ncbi:UDP-glucuronic acid decarboxylase 1-like isoform X3 [Phyllobates terribilis]|uniref:UDP-glucuronic acid decarboxylase 1-like isoform X3 n=1 Tax=Phyllobates terribilis TaxID=111132 RepID=UPI003CCAB2B7